MKKKSDFLVFSSQITSRDILMNCYYICHLPFLCTKADLSGHLHSTVNRPAILCVSSFKTIGCYFRLMVIHYYPTDQFVQNTSYVTSIWDNFLDFPSKEWQILCLLLLWAWGVGFMGWVLILLNSIWVLILGMQHSALVYIYW